MNLMDMVLGKEYDTILRAESKRATLPRIQGILHHE